MIHDELILAEDNSLIKNHSAYGRKLLPGLAYIDLFYQILQEGGLSHKSLEIKDLSIHSPLVCPPGGLIHLDIECKETVYGELLLSIEGHPEGSQENKKRFATARAVKRESIAFGESLDRSWIEHDGSFVDGESLYERCRRKGLVHTGLMKADAKIHLGEQGMLIDLCLNAEALATAEQFLFHPALIDGSALCSNLLLDSIIGDEERLYVPLFCESFSASEPIQKRLYARILNSSIRREKELVYFTVEYFDLSGQKIAELKNFAAKRVREPEHLKVDQESTLDFLKSLFADQLKSPLQQIKVDVGYYEMGLDSAGLLSIVERLSSRVNQPLSPTLLFEYTTLGQLAAYFEQNHAPLFGRPPIEIGGKEEGAKFEQKALGGDIAIIGMAGRFPKANDLDAFWQNLKEGRDCISEIPSSRWDHKLLSEIKSPSGKNISRWGGFIEDPDCFDASFFRISPREAETMDPQERLFLQTCWEAIEDAGYTPKTLTKPKGRHQRSDVGVFVGVMHKDYAFIGAEAVSKNNLFPLSLNNAPIANRVSYFCNFHGPSLAVDTVCSSSLTALHLALESLRRGECEIALAGGVNLSLHPYKYMTYGGSDMFSTDGRCRSFGKGGDGYVPAEGVGAVLLKPLEKAVKDGDLIYAVIKASAMNHVGTVSGITVPSPVAHADVIERCFERAQIDPKTISYVEAHGTGTSLGDPIEIQGLAKAFSGYTKEVQFCAIGSVKSNMGHAESAAGISGLVKVALQLFHKTLVPSLHAEQPNPYLELESTPFYLQRELIAWQVPESSLRRAAISSFGAMGSNVHLILEEYPLQKAPQLSPESEGFIIPLSAKNEDRLLAYAKRVLDFLDRKVDLADLAYTLQIGRVAMESRVSFVVKEQEELCQKLTDFLSSKKAIKGCWRGERANGFESKDLDGCSLEEIAKLWASGANIDWPRLYDKRAAHRMRLPTYPFAKERFWVPSGPHSLAARSTFLHPLLQQNSSNFDQQRFSSTFTGKEFFLADHRVRGQSILAGACHLEMVRAALEKTVGPEWGINLKEVVWLQPIACEESSIDIHIALYPEDKEKIVYEIYSQPQDGKERLLYSQGKAELCKPRPAPQGNLDELKGRCTRYALSSDNCYAAYEKLGLEFGEGHRSIDQIYVGEDELLAKLSLPRSLLDSLSDYFLHPTLLDGALQASIGLSLTEKGSLKVGSTMLPFALDSMAIFGASSAIMWAHVKQREEQAKIDIDLFDEQGKLCARLQGLSSRAVAAETPKRSTLLFESSWQAQPLEKGQNLISAAHVAIFCEVGKERLSGQIEGIEVYLFDQRPARVEKRFLSYARGLLDKIQSLLQSRPEQSILIQLVTSSEGEQRLFAALSGFLKTACLEDPRLIAQLIEIEPEETPEGIAQKLLENRTAPHDRHIRYSQGVRLVATWQEIQSPDSASELPWKEEGVYLITGGAKGLGLLFADEIAKKVDNPTLILIGRSPPDERIKSALEALKKKKANAIYKQIDVANREAVGHLIKGIIKDHGCLNGILHSAGLIKDNFLVNKSKEELKQVLAPKVAGTVNLDEASRDIALDLFVLFSSVASATGNVGQADYAAANGFMNSYADLRDSSKREGKTLSILWPLWKEGGMQISEGMQAIISEKSGMLAMSTEAGFEAFYRAFTAGRSQVMVVEGNGEKIGAFFAQEINNKGLEASPIPPKEGDSEQLKKRAEEYLKGLLSTTLKLASHKIDARAPMEQYGIDSLMVIQMTTQLERVFGPLSKTLFFEYQNISDLAGYFLRAHMSKVVEKLGPPNLGQPTPIRQLEMKPTRQQKRFWSPASGRGGERGEDIAIIGLSGRYPQASHIEQFWKNLKEGRDCITEIPKERWDHSLYFDEDKDKPEKTYSKWGGFIDDVDKFDPLFFNISPKEAEFIDPQERLFLQCVYATLEDAGYTRKTIGREVAVYVGVMYEEYPLYAAGEQARGRGIAIAGNPASIANRVSYFFNFNGPSIALDTMCSSSLTALHLACEELKQGRSDLAIAGGVNLSIHPNKYLMLGQGRFVSSQGRCESFGLGADGYVPGEGVGAVLLKPLSKAVADGDHIYALVKGTSINHGGKTNGYSVPNPQAQGRVIGDAFKNANVDPRAVSYIEAHGTGTVLGDPIEISGLSLGFGESSARGQFCAIGSVKSNIGHLESAAGIAGITKVLLQMKHQELVPSLHSETLNPHIDFSKTPFAVQQQLAFWRRPIIDGREQPRIAGISAFGAGGSNAHIVLQEYVSPVQEKPPLHATALIVLSAASREQLEKLAQEYLKALPTCGGDLFDLAFTLQMGREAFEERMGFSCHSLDEMQEKLKGFLEGKEEGIFRGSAKQNKQILEILIDDGGMEKIVEGWIECGNYSKLLELWVRGGSIDWDQLYKGSRPRRISLPTYPFAKERYWIVESKADRGVQSLSCSQLHPLLHENCSTLSEQRFKSTFSGDEFFLAEHRVRGKRILPGVAHLEMARAALVKALESKEAIGLKEIVWLRPALCEKGPLELAIRLFPEEGDEIAYEIYSEGVETEILHSQGKAYLYSIGEIPSRDLEAIKSQASSRFTKERCYETFRKLGLDYGPTFQAIEQLWVGEGQLLAKISTQPSVQCNQEQFVLHPALLDAAFHASIGFLLAADGSSSGRLSLPFAMDELIILAPCGPSIWSYICECRSSQSTDHFRKYDIDLCDESGKVCVRIKGASIKSVEEGSRSDHARSEGAPAAFGNLLLIPKWEPFFAEFQELPPSPKEQVLIIGGDEEQQASLRGYFPTSAHIKIDPLSGLEGIEKKLQSLPPLDHLFWIASHSPNSSLFEGDLIEKENGNTLGLFCLIKALLNLGYGSKPIKVSIVTLQAQCVHEDELSDPSQAALYGLVGSLAKEYPDWQIRIVDLEGAARWPLAEMQALPLDRYRHPWSYRKGRWYQQRLIPLQTPSSPPPAYRKNGAYLVLGGAGYIGETWSEYAIRRYQAKVFWIGRTPLNETIQSKLDRLAQFGPRPHYLRADASDREALRSAYQQIKEITGEIHGVIHSAMILKEQSLERMAEGAFREALATKVDASVHLAELFRYEPLDFMLFFSSLVSYIKNVKQSHYASGCAFQDAFAKRLSKQVSYPVKVLNWGYWGSQQVVQEGNFSHLLDQVGLGLIQPEEGMRATEKLLSAPLDQLAMIHTTKPIAVEGMHQTAFITLESTQKAFAPQLRKPSPFSIREQDRKQKERLDVLLSELIIIQLKSIGFFEQGTPPPTLKGFYHKWLQSTVKILVEKGLLRQKGTLYEIGKALDAASLWQRWEEEKSLWIASPNLKALAALLEATLKKLPEILTGKVAATEILFPGSSMELVGQVYKNNPTADYFNLILAEAVADYIQEKIRIEPSAKIGILEIGAGTGGTSALIFEKIAPWRKHIREYCYSDLSQAFLLHAEGEYGPANPFLTYRIVDIEKPLQPQGLDLAAFDLVVAANVLHATRNIRQSLRHAKSALRKGGWLMLNEISGYDLFTHMTFGLLEGWWRYEDSEWRISGCPGLDRESWKQVLEDEGFKNISFPADGAEELGHQTVVATSDGLIWQERALPQIPQAMSQPKESEAKDYKKESFPPQGDELKEGIRGYLIKLTGEALKISPQKIDSSEPLSRYGIDSIVVIQLTSRLKSELGEVSSTLFFEYQTIDALTDHFACSYEKPFRKLLKSSAKTESKSEQATVAAHSSQLKIGKRARFQSPINCKPEPTSAIFDVAVIGLAGRYAGSNTPSELWSHLSAGRDCITEIPESRWNWRDYFDPEKGRLGSIYTKWGGFIEDFDCFDPSFFQISPLDAEGMDPQERCFLETAYASIEDAGYTPATLSSNKKVGIFVGVMNKYYKTGYGYWSFANRISYLLNFHGPSLAVDSACSSSLTAIHLALESLYSGTSECAIAGGVNLIVDPTHLIHLSMMQMLSATPTCRAFGDLADGFVDGEGVGALVLKPLSKAIQEGDHIYGIIKGSMINAGGKTNGYTVPSPHAQAQVVSDALKRAKVAARSISYVEAHGTGTALGDPIEIAGLTKAFAETTGERGFCRVGSIKPNIGHCESAAAVASITKVLMQLKQRKLAPSIHCEEPNPNIDFASTPFRIQKSLEEWRAPIIDGEKMPLRAAVSSFGAGGANAHLILEEYILNHESPLPRGATAPFLIVLSARNKERLERRSEQLLAALDQELYRECDLSSIAYTLQVGREAMQERLGFTVRSLLELREKLKAFVQGEKQIEAIFQENIKEHKSTLALFAKDEEMDKILDNWIQKGRWNQLLELWVKGLNFDWNRLYPESKPNRLSLPTYPFIRERYWIEPHPAGTASRRLYQMQEGEEPLLFEENWGELALPLSAKAKPIHRVICFLSEKESQKEILKQLRRYEPSVEVFFLTPGKAHKKETAHKYCLDEADYNSYLAAFDEIQKGKGHIDAVLYLWALENPSRVREYGPIVHLLKATRSLEQRPDCIVLAGAYESDLDQCYLDSWVGFERSLRQALPETKLFALLKPFSKGDIAGGLQKVCQELEAGTKESVFYHEDKRYVCRRSPAACEKLPIPLKMQSCYLITGGLGGLGYLLADHLVKKWRSQLILIGRSPLDERKRKLVKKLEDRGGKVLYLEADVGDRASLQEALRKAKERFGDIQGAIHAAGVLSQESLFEKEMGSFERTLRPKIEGTLLLDELLSSQPLDFTCYFSSSASILGDFGSCDYSVANRFQSAFARRCAGKEACGKTIAINWPVWREGAMKVSSDEKTESYLKSSGQRYLETEEAIELFEKLLSQRASQYLVLVGNRTRIHRFLGLDKGSGDDTSQPLLSKEKNGLSLEQAVLQDLIEMVHLMLKVAKEKLHLDTSWTDFGLSSIHLDELSARLSRHFGFEILPLIFFEEITLGSLARYLTRQHGAALESLYERQRASSQNLQRVESLERASRRLTWPQEPIAIIGMSGRFPESDSVEELWNHIKEGRSCISRVSLERWDWRRYEKVPQWGGFLRHVDRFDPLFFQISPKEAENMDPRQRLFLEEAWHTFEDAGYMGDRIRGKSCGVYVGVEEGEFPFLAGEDVKINGCQNATLAARIAYALDLRGPTLALTAACASGLVALHQACLALKQGDCKMALVGGISLNISPISFTALNKAEMLSSDGHCRVFDQRANGLVPGEAVVALLLKPLSEAIEDRDHIYGTIKASGVNYDGKTNGITSPSSKSQAELLTNIYDKQTIDPLDIQYVMAHSTGTRLGDPMEVKALTEAFSRYTDQKQFCSIGSIKPLIGHTFAASGLVGVVCMLKAMQDELIPGMPCEVDNSYIDFKKTPFILNQKNQKWSRKGGKLRLGTISSTGVSGTNAHVVVEEYPLNRSPSAQSSPQIIVFSAKGAEELRRMAEAMLAFAQSHEFVLEDVAYTLQVGREEMEMRLALVVADKECLIQGLEHFLQEREKESTSLSIFTSCLSGSRGRLEQITDEKNLEELASHWTCGGKVVWERLHEGREPHILPLPTYPFKGERFAIPQPKEHLLTEGKLRCGDQPAERGSLRDALVRFLSVELNLPTHQIKLEKTLLDYGVDSILERKLMAHLAKDFPVTLTGREIVEHRTLADLITHLETKLGESRSQKPAARGRPSDPEIIELMEKYSRGELDFEIVQRAMEEVWG